MAIKIVYTLLKLPSHLIFDGFLDFVFVCHGYDAHPYQGEHSYVMLSLGANSYKINQLTDKLDFIMMEQQLFQ